MPLAATSEFEKNYNMQFIFIFPKITQLDNKAGNHQFVDNRHLFPYVCSQWKCYDRLSYTSLIARFIGPTRGPSGAYRTQVGPMLAPWILLSGLSQKNTWLTCHYHSQMLYSIWYSWGGYILALVSVNIFIELGSEMKQALVLVYLSPHILALRGSLFCIMISNMNS